jgi:hypothetical protein
MSCTLVWFIDGLMRIQHATGSDPGAFCEARSGIYVRELDVCVIFLVFKGNNLHSGFSPTVDAEVERKWKEKMSLVRTAWNLAGPENRAGFVSYPSKVAFHRLGAMSITPSLMFGNAGADPAHKDVYMDYARHGMHIVGSTHAHFNRLAREIVYHNHNYYQFTGLQGPDPAEALVSLKYTNDDGKLVHCDPIPFHAVEDADLLAYWRGRYKWHYLNCQQYHVAVVKHRYKKTQAKLKEAIATAQSTTTSIRIRSGIPRWVSKSTTTKQPGQSPDLDRASSSTAAPEMGRCESPLTELDEDSSADEDHTPSASSTVTPSTVYRDIQAPSASNFESTKQPGQSPDLDRASSSTAAPEMGRCESPLTELDEDSSADEDHTPSASSIVTPSTVYRDIQAPSASNFESTKQPGQSPDLDRASSSTAAPEMGRCESPLTELDKDSSADEDHTPSASSIVTPSTVYRDIQAPSASNFGSTNYVHDFNNASGTSLHNSEVLATDGMSIAASSIDGQAPSQLPAVTPSATNPTSDLTSSDVEMMPSGQSSLNNLLSAQKFTPKGSMPDLSVLTSNGGSKKRKLSDRDETADDNDSEEMDQQQDNGGIDDCGDSSQSGGRDPDIGLATKEITGSVGGSKMAVDVVGGDGERRADDEDGYEEDSEGDSENDNEGDSENDSEDDEDGDEDPDSDPVYDVEDVLDRRTFVHFLSSLSSLQCADVCSLMCFRMGIFSIL